MELIRKRAFARAGLFGNPSDGYFGKTISVIVRDFWAEVVLYEWEDIELIGSAEDQSRFRSVHELVRDVGLHGYYGGLRLVKATVKKFVQYCERQGVGLHRRNFSIRYETTIPRQVGLAGSSAIIVATLRCLMAFYDVSIPQELQPSLARAVETEELGIAAGLQDRVIQVYEGLVYMDFSTDVMAERHGLWCGRYAPLDPGLLPPLYLAYSTGQSEPTEVTHNNLRLRYEQGEPAVVKAMADFARLTDEAKTALEGRDAERLGTLMDRNFDLRRSICQIPRGQELMVRVARTVGASAKFAGSGGAIVGQYRDEATYERLQEELGRIQCRVFKPQVVPPPAHDRQM